jgi:hypothetical protein
MLDLLYCQASTVTEYLAALPADRREALNEVRRGINRALPNRFAKSCKSQTPSSKESGKSTNRE